MTTEEVLKHLTERLDLLQRTVVRLTQDREKIDRQIRVYKELIRYYRAVFEAEHGVGKQAELSPEIIRLIEEEQITIPKSLEKVTRSGWSVPKAIDEVLPTDTGMHAKLVSDTIRKRYPDEARNIKNLDKTVGSALVRGYQQGKYERVARNTYRKKQ